MIEIPRAALTADEIAKRGRLLLLRHQRPDPDDLRLLPGRRRQVPGRLLRPEDLRVRPLRQAGPDRRGPADGDGRQAGPVSQRPDLHWASAASTAATPPPWSSATRSAWTMSPAPPSACRSPASPPRRPPSRTRSKSVSPDPLPPRLERAGAVFLPPR